MQLLQRFSHAFRDKLSFSKDRARSPISMSARELMVDLNRQLYSMRPQEQSVVGQILTMAGEPVLIEQDTFAIDKKNNPRYLGKGQKVRISKCPLTFDLWGDARINILDESDKPLSMRLSDYIQDIHANR
jgi:hypothetical protein